MDYKLSNNLTISQKVVIYKRKKVLYSVLR